jgi:hypothetical protein
VEFDLLTIRNSIEFSFNLASKIKKKKIPTIYLHCNVEICTDLNAKSVTSKDKLFYSQFRQCDSMAEVCQLNSKNLQEKRLKQLNSSDQQQQRNAGGRGNRFRIPVDETDDEAAVAAGTENDDDDEEVELDEPDEVDIVEESPSEYSRNDNEKVFAIKPSIRNDYCNRKFSYGPIDLTDRLNNEKIAYLDDEFILNNDNNKNSANVGGCCCSSRHPWTISGEPTLSCAFCSIAWIKFFNLFSSSFF